MGGINEIGDSIAFMSNFDSCCGVLARRLSCESGSLHAVQTLNSSAALGKLLSLRHICNMVIITLMSLTGLLYGWQQDNI